MSADVRIVPLAGSGISAGEVAEKHVEIRRGQEADGTNWFPDLFDSQVDLRAAQEFYAAPGGFWVALDASGQLVGFVGLKAADLGLGWLKRLAVDPSMRGQGIGARLVAAVIGHAVECGYRYVWLSTGRREHARPIYEAAGFREMWVDEAHDDYVMACPIWPDMRLPGAMTLRHSGESPL